MINLLPPALDEEYRYARRNRHLLHWIVGAAAGLVGLVALTVFGFLYMDHSISSYQTTIQADNASLQTQNVDAVESQVKDISNNLKLVVKVLSHEVLFADLLKQIATVTPPNVVLTNLSISQADNAIDITAQSTDYASGARLVANLNDPGNKIFSKADLVNSSCQSKTTGVAVTYPCSFSIRALFAQNNPYLFINGKITP